MKIRLTVLLALLAVCSCRNTNQSEKRSADEDSVLLTLKEYSSTADIQKRISFYDDSSAFYWIPAGTNACFSRDSLIDILKHSDAHPNAARFNWDEIKVEIKNAGSAVYEGTFTLNNEQSVNRYREEGTLIKRSGGWKLLSGYTTPLPRH